MELFSLALEKWGLKAAILIYIANTLFQWLSGTTKKWFKSLEDNSRVTKENTEAIKKLQEQMALQPKMTRDLKISFDNIRQIREKLSMGPIIYEEKPQWQKDPSQ